MKTSIKNDSGISRQLHFPFYTQRKILNCVVNVFLNTVILIPENKHPPTQIPSQKMKTCYCEKNYKQVSIFIRYWIIFVSSFFFIKEL